MTQQTPDLAVDSVTGVDVSLPVAGPGARSFAFLIDWHIRAIVSIAWYVVAALFYNGRWTLSAPLSPDASWFIFVITPPVAIYFLYHYVLELVMHGRTPGKRTAGVHLVARDGGAPSISALLIRNVFRLVDSLPLFYGVGLVATLLTRDHVRVGDMAAGTLLVYDRIDTSLLERINSASLGGRLDAQSAELVNELLLRWSTLDIQARDRLARSILSRYAPGAAENDDDSLRLRLERLTQRHPHE